MKAATRFSHSIPRWVAHQHKLINEAAKVGLALPNGRHDHWRPFRNWGCPWKPVMAEGDFGA
ncbi:hypothetical protein WN944_017342 [Citrus x changshan-huyou]|uniref:Uncharacterized protein n=1 Tax=Citrus x changshan-huyou TaxID=2935761 RepID=A0AAP0QSW8_9ROSI